MAEVREESLGCPMIRQNERREINTGNMITKEKSLMTVAEPKGTRGIQKRLPTQKKGERVDHMGGAVATGKGRAKKYIEKNDLDHKKGTFESRVWTIMLRQRNYEGGKISNISAEKRLQQDGPQEKKENPEDDEQPGARAGEKESSAGGEEENRLFYGGKTSDGYLGISSGVSKKTDQAAEAAEGLNLEKHLEFT